MLVFWDQRLTFLATPKTGSTAIETALEPLSSMSMLRPTSMRHLTAQEYCAHLAPLLRAQTDENFTSIAMMRDPIDWLRSWYRFYLRDALDDYALTLRTRGFEAFVRDYIDQHDSLAPISAQHKFLCDPSGSPLVDRIFRYEMIDDFVRYLEDRLDCIVTLPRLNVPPAVDVALSSATEQDLRAAMHEDFDLYAGLAS
jgi:hypothetical protein